MSSADIEFAAISQGKNRSVPEFLSTQIANYKIRAMGHGKHILKGQLPDDDAIVLSSNDYLCLSNDPKINAAQAKYLLSHGRGLMRSDVFRHEIGPLKSFELQMAAWTKMPAALVAQSGWNANVGLIQSLATPEVPVYLDMEAHMSLWEGVRSAQSHPRPFTHNSVRSLENMLKRHGSGVIAVDSLYSTSGSIAPLAEIAALSKRYGCLLVVDESHSMGLYGPQGAGLVAEFGLSDDVDFITASLSKTFASRGGIIMGDEEKLEFLRYSSFPAIFSSGVMNHEAAGFIATLEIIKDASLLRADLQSKANYLKYGILAHGYNVSNSESHIISLVTGDDKLTITLRDALEDRNVFGSVFCWPATGKKRSLVRFSLHGQLDQQHLDYVVWVLGEIKTEVQVDAWVSSKRTKLTVP